MISQIVGTGCGVLGTLLSGCILYIIKSGQAKARKREELRDKKWMLMVKALKSGLAVNNVMCRCIKGEAHNGDLTTAQETMNEAMKSLDDFITEAGLRNI